MIKLYKLENKGSKKVYYFKASSSIESRLKMEMNQSKINPSSEFQNELLEVKSMNNINRFYKVDFVGSFKTIDLANKFILDFEKKSKKKKKSEENVTGNNSADSN